MSGKFLTQIKELEKLLSSVNLLEEFLEYPSSINLSLSEIRRLSYTELWEEHYKQNCYHYNLIDGALIYFNISNFSFSYIGCPYECMSFEEFLFSEDLLDEKKDYSLYSDYHQYISECSIREYPYLVRYDYDEESYNPGLHPAAHFHLGFNNDTRIGIHYIMSPKSFLYFILRQLYPEYWNIALKKKLISPYIKKLAPINQKKFYNSPDELELYLK